MPHNSKRMKHRARVLIVDDHADFAEKCRVILEPQFEVVGVVLDGSDVPAVMAALKPDVVIIDVGMQSWSGFELGEQVKAGRPDTRLIYMTAAAEFIDAVVAFRRGGSGYVSKLDFPDELLVAVRCAIRGDMHLSPRVTKRQIPFKVDCGLTASRGYARRQLGL